MWMNGQHCGQSKASSAFPCTGILKMMPPSFQSLHRLSFHYFGSEGLVPENLANSTSPFFVSTSVCSRAKFSLSKMKKEETCLLVTPLSILCIHKKRSELFYNRLVRIHTKGYMQKSNRLLRDILFHIESAWTAFPHLTPVRKISVALLWHYNKHLAWTGFQSSHSQMLREPFWRECVCTCVCLCMEEFELTPKCCSSLLGDTLHSRDYGDSCPCVLHVTFYKCLLLLFLTVIFHLCNFSSPQPLPYN